MWTLKLTIKQIENLIDHVDSPYIRAIGFLYLRYVCAPAQLWDWFQYYLEDEEVVQISSGQNPTKVTIGKLCRMLITEPKFQGTMLPRIPVPIARDLEKKLQDYDREKKHQDQPAAREEEREDDRYHRHSSRDRYRSRSPVKGRGRDDRGSRYDRSSRERSSRDEYDDYERSSRRRYYDDDRYRRRSPDYSRRYRSRSPSRDDRRSRNYSRDRD
ncbi:PRP38 family-domain-containing protein [Gilbertella persicaria]|nr:PRP38 family-domain-containing protein [Gilbertella persicaria]KAI8069056.1 PRP38 family-domain-containing protein [Gilbertella persicaria]